MNGHGKISAWGVVLGMLACAALPHAQAQGSPPGAAVSLARILKPAPATQPGQSATLLPEGRWLLTGGRDAQGAPVATAVLVDPRTTQSRALASGLIQPRSGHSATLLADGTVLVLGGKSADGTVADGAERFDPAKGRFEPLGDLGLIPRAQHTATLLSNGRLLIAGGVDGRGDALYDVELYDTRTKGVENFNARLESARLSALAALLPANTVLLWGGVDASGAPSPGAELFDPAQLRFLPYTTANALELAASLQGPGVPAVAASDPADGDQDISVDARLSVRFSKRMDVTSLNAQTVVLMSPNGALDVKVTPAETGVLLFVTPSRELLPDSHYTLFISGARDLLGQELALTAIGFRSAALVPASNGAAPQGSPNDPTTPAPSPGQSKKAEKDLPFLPGAGAADEDDEWIPTAANFKGEWRTGRARERARLTLPRRPEVLRAIHGVGGVDGAASVPAGVTAVAGQVLRLNGRPLANVTLSMAGRSVQTDANGEFLLAEVPAGGQILVIDGATASKQLRYGRYEYRMNVKAGELNALPFVIWMTRLDTGNAVGIASPTISETVVTTARIPGLELRIPPGKVIRDAAGKIVTEINITAIPVDQPPFPLPNVPVPVYFTIQPGGAHLEDVAGTGAIGARLIYPNFSGGAPGARMDFWNYDSRERGWYVYGQGSVSPDGRQTIPDPGVAIYEFTGAMIGGPGNAPGNGPPPGGCRWGDPVDCYTGLFLHERVDLRINDVVPIEVARTYRPQDAATRAFGIGTMLAYDIFLVGDTDPWSYQELILPDGGRVRYNRISPGTHWTTAVYEHKATPTAFHGSTISWNGAGWTLRLRDGTAYKFPEAYQTTNFRKGAATQMLDRFGNAVNLARDSNGNLTQIVSPNGRRISLAYDASNRISQASDDLGRTVAYQYDASGRLQSVTDPLGGVEQYTYDASHRMLTVRDKRNNFMVTNVYDANGRVQTQTYADSTTNTFAYTLNGSGQATQLDVTDERGFVKRMTFGSSGYPLTITRALGTAEEQVFTNAIDAATNLLSSRTDALGRTTAFQYDTLGNMTQMTLLSGTASAVSWSYTYGPVHNQVTSVTDPLNHTTSFEYDSLGSLVRVTDPLNHITEMSYTGSGQISSVTDPLSHTTSLSYAGGDLASVTDPLGRTVSFASDALGRVVAVTDPLGNRSQIAYDALDRVTARTDALGQQASFGYDANGNLTSFTDAKTNVTGFAYDARNRRVTKTDALTQAESYAYDAAGNLSFVTDRKGQVRGFTYDGLGRRTQAGFGAASTTSPVYESTITYTYDAANRVTQMADSANGTITRQYDDRFDSVTQETTPQGSVAYAYDAAGRRSSMSPSGGTQVGYSFDAANRLTQISQGASTVSFAYDEANRRTTLTLANGVTLSYGYDAANQLTGITYRDAASTLLGDLTYAYDLTGRRTAMGGSFARAGLPAALSSATYDANNRLTAWGGASLSHDANGNLLGFQGKSYAWNSRDQLAAISGSATASFAYDALGRREGKTVAGASRQFLYDGLNPVQERSGGAVAASVLTGLGVDEFFARTEGAGTEHYLSDALGSTLRLTDGSATKIVDYAYEAYGETSADASSNNPFQYTGRENDGTGLYYYRARYYDPVLKRFISEDPIGLDGGLNFYAYVGGNPITRSDPFGLINILVGGGFSAVAPTGIEGGGGLVVNPGLFGQKADVGLFGAWGAGIGANVSADLFVGYVNGGIADVSGSTLNQNFVIGPLSITLFHDPKTGEVVGGTAGLGPPSYLPAGYSGTYSQTGTWTLRDTFRFYRDLFRKFSSNAQYCSPQR